MSKKRQEKAQEKTGDNEQLKNQNPNQQHNTKKVALGPNTKR